MSWVIGKTVVGRDNRSPGNPAGPEMVNSTPIGGTVGPLEATYRAATVSTTLARTNDTVTATATSHGVALGDIVKVAGADQAGYNGLFKALTVADANTYTYTAYGSPTSPATGTITTTIVLLETVPD